MADDLFSVAGKVALVTGGTGGIGLMIARGFVRRGAKTYIASRDAERGRAAAEALSREGGQCVGLAADLAAEDGPEALGRLLAEREARLDVLVNNAGIGAFGFVTEITPEVWDRVIATTLSSVFYASRAAIPHLIRRKGNIVNTASISGLAADVGFAAYNAAKGGVVNLTRAMAIDHAADGIRVNALCPGVVEAGSTGWMVKNEKLMQGFADRVPMGRMAQPEEMAGAILFLASDDASYMTGSNMVVDGGLLAGTGQPQFRRIVEKAGW